MFRVRVILPDPDPHAGAADPDPYPFQSYVDQIYTLFQKFYYTFLNIENYANYDAKEKEKKIILAPLGSKSIHKILIVRIRIWIGIKVERRILVRTSLKKC